MAQEDRRSEAREAREAERRRLQAAQEEIARRERAALEQRKVCTLHERKPLRGASPDHSVEDSLTAETRPQSSAVALSPRIPCAVWFSFAR